MSILVICFGTTPMRHKNWILWFISTFSFSFLRSLFHINVLGQRDFLLLFYNSWRLLLLNSLISFRIKIFVCELAQVILKSRLFWVLAKSCFGDSLYSWIGVLVDEILCWNIVWESCIIKDSWVLERLCIVWELLRTSVQKIG